MNKLKSGAVISYIYLAVESLTSLIFTPMLVEYLGDSEYGIYGLAATVTAYLLLLDLGVGNALVRYFAKYRINCDKDSEKKLLGISILYYTLISVVSFGVLIVTILFVPTLFSKGLSPFEIVRAKEMFLIVGLNAVVTLIESPFKRILVAYEKFVLSKGLSLGKVCLRFAISFLVLTNGGLGVAVLVVNLALTVATTIFEVLYVFYRMKVRPVFRGTDKSLYKEIVGYSSIIFLQMIASQINNMVGQVTITMFIVSASTYLAVYNVAINITHYFQNIAGAVNSLLMPSAVKAVEEKSDSTVILAMMVRISRIQIIILGAIYTVFLLNGKEFIGLWVGTEKEYAYYAATIIMLPMFFSLSQGIGSQLLWAMNKHKIQAVLKIGATIVNIALTVVLVNAMEPILGAAIGTGVSMLIGDVIIPNCIFKKEIGISIQQYYKQQYKGLLLCLLLTFVCGYVFKYFISIANPTLDFIVSCLFAVFVYAVSLWFVGLNNSEKRMIISHRMK